MLEKKLQESSDYIKANSKTTPELGIILGSGLGPLQNIVEIEAEINYTDIPHFPQSTVEGHGKKLLLGKIGDKPVMLFSGRFHYYEGYDMQQVTYPVRMMKAMGCTHMILSNASGGLNPNFEVGDIMIIRDHINLFPEHPLRGPNDESIGPRFPDMSEPYKYNLIDVCKGIAEEEKIKVYEGVYVGLQGPTFETRSEYKYLRIIGGDAVGMSTVPEVIVGVHAGLTIFGISIITDVGIRDEMNTITHEEVLEASAQAAPKVSRLIEKLIAHI